MTLALQSWAVPEVGIEVRMLVGLPASAVEERLDEAVIRLPTLAGRYVGEMEQVAEAFAEIGLTPGFHDAAAEVYRLLADTPLAAQRREEIDPDRTTPETLAILVEHLKTKRTT